MTPTRRQVVTRWHELLRSPPSAQASPQSSGVIWDGAGGYDPFGLLVLACIQAGVEVAPGVPMVMPDPADKRGLPHPMAAACGFLHYDQIHGHPSEAGAWCSGGQVYDVANLIESAVSPARAWRDVAAFVKVHLLSRVGDEPCIPGVLLEGVTL